MLKKVGDLVKASTKRDYGDAHLLAVILVQLGEKDEAFVWLNRAADVKHPGIPTLRVDALFDDVRSDPRIEQLMKRVGI